jgi:hypothetical protein
VKQCQERGRAKTTEEVILLKSAIEAYTDGDVKREDQCLYPEATLEVNARYQGPAVHPPPSPAAMLHQDMVLTRARRSQNIMERIERHAQFEAWKSARFSGAGLSNTMADAGGNGTSPSL